MSFRFRYRVLCLLLLSVVLSVSICFADSVGSVEESGLDTVAASVSELGFQVDKRAVSLGGVMTGWLHMLDGSSPGEGNGVHAGLISSATKVPADLYQSLKGSGGERGLWGVILAAILSLMAIAGGYAGKTVFRKSFAKGFDRLTAAQPEERELWSKLTVALLHVIPRLLELFVLSIVSVLLFLILSRLFQLESKMVFQLFLGSLIVMRALRLLIQALFSPGDERCRLVTIRGPLLQPVVSLVYTTLAFILVAMLFVRYVKELGVQDYTYSWVLVICGTVLLIPVCLQILGMKNEVRESLLENVEEGSLRAQIADYWLIPVFFYLFACWSVWMGREFTGTSLRNGSFIVSVLIIPGYLGLSAIAKLIIYSVVASLDFFQEKEVAVWEQQVKSDEDEKKKTPEEKTLELSAGVHKYFNIFLICVLVAWLLNLWGYQLPFAQKAMKAVFQTFIMVSVALVCWRYAAKYIERKIEEATPKDIEKKEDSDDEFGGAAPRGRSHTLLPMLRKVVATVLIVMVVMVVISSFGVDIGPLLAGAGVLGLAIGFGAQKLVSDVLSGFFFLLDDAFRVGEYIQAGSMKGTVEAITLRNVLLRHHLGMLQVVPHSDLGAITNFMRGGIVVRFPLEFPYDTNIDQVRKIIKKVGQAMLTDPEIEDDFILPVKSQGVYEITNSVMVIRVKFTAKPGKQFLIRREAYRRITEALNAKGIYYAHRKVIVDFPEGTKPANLSPEESQKIALAGAAGAQAMEDAQHEQETSDHDNGDMK